MITHTPLYHELYKFTNEYKNSEVKKIVNKFIFKQPSVNNTDGCNFINPNTLYSNELNIIPDAKIYFNNATNSDGFYNKHIKLCIPFSEINKPKTVLNRLNRYIYNSINVRDDVYTSSIESLNIRNVDLNNKYPLSQFRKNTITKWVYGIEFTVKEFYEATGIYLFISRRKKDINSNNYKYYSSCINSNYNLGDGLNIRISVKNNTYLEINFVDRNIDTIENLYELSIYYSPQRKLLDEFINYNSSMFDFMYTDMYSIIENEEDDRIVEVFDTFTFNNMIYKPLINVELIINIINKENYVLENYKFHLYDYEYNIYRINKHNAKISLNLDNDYPLKQLLDSIDIDKYQIIYTFNLHLKKYNSTSIFERKDYLEKYSIYNDSYFKSSEIKSDMTPKEISDILTMDEENLINCLPFSLENILNRKSTFNIRKIKNVLYENIEFRNRIPYIKYTLNSKHDTVMFFRDSKLITPEFIEHNGSDYSIYIPIKDMISNDTFENIRKMKYNIISKNKYIALMNNVNLWIVYDTDRHFIENIRYDIKSVYIYVNIDNTLRYSISIDENNKEIYLLDSNGEYIKYKDNYLELGSKEYYLVNGNYIETKPDNYSGNIYRKTKTNEYLLPLNKNIDPSKIVITIEDYHDDHSNLKYIKDPEGSYIKLDEDRYYQTYNTTFKNDLYVNINNTYIRYNENEHSDYLGSFYIKKEPGYILPPYYYHDDIRYRKISKTCIILSNIFNISYDNEVVSVDSYYNDDNHVIRNKTYDKESFVNKMLYKKYKLKYPINDLYYYDGDYKLYNSTLNMDSELLYYKNELDYINKNEVDNYISEIRNFIDMNRVYKFSLNNKEILDIDNTIEEKDYIFIDAETSENIQYVFINGDTSIDKNSIFYNSDYDITDDDITSYTYGEVLDGGYGNTDEYMSIIDGGYSTSFSHYPNTITKEEAIDSFKNGENVYIYIDDKPVLYKYYLYPDYEGPFYKDFSNEVDRNENYVNNELDINDDYPIYDFNFTSPYSINDEKVKAYRIDASYSNYLNSDDEFLAFVIPNQLINSENKLLTFLDGKFSDEFAINKNLYSRLFGGDTLLSITEDPKDYTGNDYSYRVDKNGKYYFNGTSYEYIPDRNIDVMTRIDDTTYYKTKYEYDGKIRYITTETYDSNDIESETRYEILPDGSYSISDTGEYYKLKNGNYILIEHYGPNILEIESYDKYYELENEYNGLKYINIQDYYTFRTSYSKNIHNVFICNMKNLTLYQNIRGITYKDKIFTVNNNIDTIVHNDRKLYKDIYFPPLSLTYMLFFINGKFANPYIEIISPQRFIISDSSFLVDGEEINDIQIYGYDKYLYNLNHYKNFFNTNEDINKLHGYNIYTYKDNMWDKYGTDIIENIKNNNSVKDQIYIPKNTGYHAETSLISLYEIFGKYILNKYDIDNDFTLNDEIREYFAPLFDENNRMKLELIQDQIRRKYIY